MFSKSLLFGLVLDGLLAVAIVIAQALPVPSGPWPTIALLGMLCLQAWQMYLSAERDKATKTAVDGVAVKTEVVHKALNSQLDAFKAEAAAQYKLALDQGINIAKMAATKETDAKLTLLETKIASLESKLDNEREKAVALAIKHLSTIKDGPNVTNTINNPPEKRLEERKGQQ